MGQSERQRVPDGHAAWSRQRAPIAVPAHPRLPCRWREAPQQQPQERRRHRPLSLARPACRRCEGEAAGRRHAWWQRATGCAVHVPPPGCMGAAWSRQCAPPNTPSLWLPPPNPSQVSLDLRQARDPTCNLLGNSYAPWSRGIALLPGWPPMIRLPSPSSLRSTAARRLAMCAPRRPSGTLTSCTTRNSTAIARAFCVPSEPPGGMLGNEFQWG